MLKSQFFWLSYAIALTLLSFRLFFLLGMMVLILFSMFFFFRWSGLEKRLSAEERRSYLLAVLLYPAIETLVKLFQNEGIISSDFTLINRLEHCCWAVALPFFFLPVIADFWKKLLSWQNLVFLLGFVCLLGNANEFLEYLLRIERSPMEPALFSRYYSDTILDMVMNLLGGAIAFVLLNSVLAKPKSQCNYRL